MNRASETSKLSNAERAELDWYRTLRTRFTRGLPETGTPTLGMCLVAVPWPQNDEDLPEGRPV